MNQRDVSEVGQGPSQLGFVGGVGCGKGWVGFVDTTLKQDSNI